MKLKPHLVLFTTALALGGCASRVHLTESHGRSNRAVLSAQVANPEAGAKARPLPGLDAQEASIVARNYRRSLATKGGQSNDDRGGMLILAPNQPAQPSFVPPPSVPERR